MATRSHFTLLDKVCLSVDQALRTVSGHASAKGAISPAEHVPDAKLTDSERKHAAALMRINHSGEVAAQALYHGQGMVSRNLEIHNQMQQAALEEGDHLSWCQQRINELGGRTSYLNPVWYAGSFCIGMVAGMVGDKWSLGFVAETEQQVIKHLQSHLYSLPPQDAKSNKILTQMEQDESKHRDDAINAGAQLLPIPIKKMMAFTAKIMVKTSYWL